MSKQEATAVVPYTPQQMYDLVVDMDRYPEFLPWCVRACKRDEQPESFVAEMTMSFRGLRESFRTIDRLYPPREVRISLLSGPFSSLENRWLFIPVDRGTRVDFVIEFQFRNRLIDLAMGPFFGQASREMVSAFRRRAGQLYG